MKNAASLEVYAYWNTLRKNRSAPLRSEIDPLQVKTILPDLFMLKLDGNQQPTFGLTGTRLYNLFQTELGRLPFASIWQESIAEYASYIASGVMEHELPVIFDLQGKTTDGVEILALEMVLLPFAREQNSPRRVLGCISCEPARGDFARPLSPLIITQSNLLQPPKPYQSDVMPVAARYALSK